MNRRSSSSYNKKTAFLVPLASSRAASPNSKTPTARRSTRASLQHGQPHTDRGVYLSGGGLLATTQTFSSHKVNIMGVVLSIFSTIGVAVRVLLQANRDLQEVLQRASQAPGLPNPNPSDSYWLDDPPYPELVNVQSKLLPEDADIVIIGSGITAAAVAWSILQQHRGQESATGQVPADRHDNQDSQKSRQPGAPPRIIVLEARSLCSGATGRNGGHIKPSPQETFADFKDKLGPARAAELARFQLRHVEMIPELCAHQGWDIAECRRVQTCDMYVDAKDRDDSFAHVRELKQWVPELVIDCLSEKQAQEVSWVCWVLTLLISERADI